MKQKTTYTCSDCGATYPRWEGKCAQCGSWGTIEETIIQQGTKKPTAVVPSKKLIDISTEESTRIPSPVAGWDEVLGGGMMADGVTILTARPGAGKSTLLLQMAAQYATSGKNVLYASGEESAAQIRARADRILSPIPQNIWLFATTDLDAVLAQAEDIRADILIVDSIQTFRTQEHTQRAGTPVQTVACTEKIVQHCKSGPQKCAAILVGHMTKNDEMAGLRTLEHMVDTVLLLEGGDMDELRMLRSTKNRFGQTGEIAVFAMEHTGLREITDPSEHFITHRDKGVIGSAKAVIREGTRTFIIEVESLVSKSYSPYPIRISENMSRDRLNTLLSILEERAGLSLQDKNVIIKTTGGVRLTEPASDLAVMMSVASSILKTSIPEHVVYAAEVGLTGELKRVTYEKQRIKEAQRLGYTLVGIDMKSGRTVSEIIRVLK